LGITTKISKKYSGHGNFAYHTQFGDVLFYDFLLSLGLFPAKSNTLGALKIPKKYFVHFVRGYFDGDGSSYSYFDSVFPKSFRFYISFTSGSKKYLSWFRRELKTRFGISGYLSYHRNTPHTQLKYSKKEAIIFVNKIYKQKGELYLNRKWTKIENTLREIRSLKSNMK